MDKTNILRTVLSASSKEELFVRINNYHNDIIYPGLFGTYANGIQNGLRAIAIAALLAITGQKDKLSLNLNQTAGLIYCAAYCILIFGDDPNYSAEEFKRDIGAASIFNYMSKLSVFYRS